jgi:hypothetical protein
MLVIYLKDNMAGNGMLFWKHDRKYRLKQCFFGLANGVIVTMWPFDGVK